jgi:dihydropteroate synthase
MEDVSVMGVLNVTPDSFYDGGEYNEVEKAVDRAEEMVENGADIVDVGGESTNPDAEAITVEEEKSRVIPVVEKLELEAEISVDTRNPETAREALEAGADIINDVTGLESEEMRELVAEKECRAVIMDSKNVPVVRSSEGYREPVEEVEERLEEKVRKALESGIDKEQLIVDPGIGFGRDEPEEDGKLIANLDQFKQPEIDLMVGCSRKSFFDGIGDWKLEERMIPSVAANLLAAEKGADILRVHDVEETVKALKTWEELRKLEE